MNFNQNTVDLSLDEDNFDIDLNPGEFTAAAIGAGTVVASVGVTAMAAPQFYVPPAIAGIGCWLLGYNKRHGHLPFMGEKEQAAKTAPAAVPASQPAAAVATVTDHSGNEVDVEGL